MADGLDSADPSEPPASANPSARSATSAASAIDASSPEHIHPEVVLIGLGDPTNPPTERLRNMTLSA